MKNLHNYLAKSVGTGVLNTALSALSVLVFLPLIIQNIGIEKYGIWAILAIFTSAATIADMGISKALVYFIPKEDNQAAINRIFSAGFLVNSVVVLALCMATVVIIVCDVDLWHGNRYLASDTGSIITLCGAAIFIASLATSLYRALIESLLKIYVVNLAFMALTILYYGSAYITTLLTDDVEVLIIVSASVYGAIFFFHIYYVYRHSKVRIVWPGIKVVKDLLRYASGSFSISLLGMIVQPFSRYYFVVSSDDSRLYGYFDISIRLALMANSLLTALAVPMLSVFASYGKEGLQKINYLLDRYFYITVMFYLLGLSLFYVFGEILISTAFKIESRQLFYACLIIIGGVGIAGVAEGFARALLAIGDLHALFRVRLLLPATNFTLIWYLSWMEPLSRFSIALSAAFGITSIATILVYKVRYSRRKK